MIERIWVSAKNLSKFPFSGSIQNMRYFVRNEGEHICAYVYPKPYCFEVTPDEQKIKAEFPPTEEGVEQARVWLNDQYDSHRDKWNG